ncbi:putative E3 ubiquitin-protein ligase LIN isoform X2 [Nymphaea colorata]|uniref:putative E3 ubiquitin-protein ligase LIN isoform X2 n=1 Tax=Nymphaea colorata TaxID=210225 RepID=UPI00129E1AED|nr:putative E3 ubiquitin-protein ligase LIN isoform X2 [Nymphaea colorata]
MPLSLEELLAQEGFRRRPPTERSTPRRSVQSPAGPDPAGPSEWRPPLRSARKSRNSGADSAFGIQLCRDTTTKGRTRSLRRSESGSGFPTRGSSAGTPASETRSARDARDSGFPIQICGESKLLSQGSHRRIPSELSTPRRSVRKPVLSDAESRISARVCRNGNAAAPVTTAGSAGCGPVTVDDDFQAVVSILSGFAGKFIKDERFRVSIRDRCCACLDLDPDLETWGSSARRPEDAKVLSSFRSGVEAVERSAKNRADAAAAESLRGPVRSLGAVSGLASSKKRHLETSGIPNSRLGACAELYLSVAYKLARDDRASAKHLLQVFCDSPFMARTALLPELWDYLFLPHLLHLKVWYNQELGSLSEGNHVHSRRVRVLGGLYNEQMDMGTLEFATYYKDWVKNGVRSADFPSISVPSRPKLSNAQPLIRKSLYQTVFSPACEVEWDGNGDRLPRNHEEPPGKRLLRAASSNSALGNREQSSTRKWANARLDLTSELLASEYFHLFSCHRQPETGSAICNHTEKSNDFGELNLGISGNDLSRPIKVLYTSDNLSDCEIAVRLIAKAWLDSQGDPMVELSLSKAAVVEGILEVISSSKDDEILELSMSILAELVVRNKVNRQIILNADPQLEIFVRLLRNDALFLKAGVLLYLLKPRARQMLSHELVELILRVLQDGDRIQSLFTVKCSPRVAALYLLEQILTGFDIDKNVENAKQVVSLGGLELLIRTLEVGDSRERKSATGLLNSCIQGDGDCRHYLAENIKKSFILELLLSNEGKSSSSALSLLIELLCLNGRSQINKFLDGLKNEGSVNTMHVLLVYLQHAPIEQRPLIAVVLLQLDLLLSCRVILLGTAYIEQKQLMLLYHSWTSLRMM